MSRWHSKHYGIVWRGETLIICWVTNFRIRATRASYPAFLQVLPQIYAKFFNKPRSAAHPRKSSSSFHSLGFELLFSWSNSVTVTSRVRHLKMDSRDSTVKSRAWGGGEGGGNECLEIRCPDSQMWMLSRPPLLLLYLRENFANSPGFIASFSINSFVLNPSSSSRQEKNLQSLVRRECFYIL